MIVQLTKNDALKNDEAKQFQTSKRLKGEIYTVTVYQTLE